MTAAEAFAKSAENYEFSHIYLRIREAITEATQNGEFNCDVNVNDEGCLNEYEESLLLADGYDLDYSRPMLSYNISWHKEIRKSESIAASEALKDPETAYHYAKNILKSRWLEAEPIILKNQHYTYFYWVNILNCYSIKGKFDRWPEAEPILKNSEWWEQYERMMADLT